MTLETIDDLHPLCLFCIAGRKSQVGLGRPELLVYGVQEAPLWMLCGGFGPLGLSAVDQMMGIRGGLEL